MANAVISAIERNRAEVEVAPVGLRLGTAVASVAPALSAAVAAGWERADRAPDRRRPAGQRNRSARLPCSAPPIAGYDRGMDDAAFWRELGQQLRVDSIRSSDAAGSGHPPHRCRPPTVAVLFARHLHYDFGRPDDPRNDHLIFSKGHASPLYYSSLKAAGAITDEELLTFRKLGSRFEGHPTPVLPWVDVATGSLGQGLPIGVGVALAGKRLEQMPYRVWVLCGDSEMAEGSMWEAFEHAAYNGLDNLTAIIDVNRLGQTRETMHGWDLDSYADRARAFGWHAIEIDGHDVEEIDGATRRGSHIEGRPTVVVARTRRERERARSRTRGQARQAAVGSRGGDQGARWRARPARRGRKARGRRRARIRSTPAIAWSGRAGTATTRSPPAGPTARRWPRSAPSAADIVALDGEVSNSTYSEMFAKAHPDRYFEMFIAEQQMVAAAVGLQVRGYRPFASTFAAFFSRAYDFVRMAAISRATVCLAGSHAGVSIGEDGPSQMALEDLADVPRRPLERGPLPVRPEPGGGARAADGRPSRDRLHAHHSRRHAHASTAPTTGSRSAARASCARSDEDQVTLIGAGVTLHEALKAADKLAEQGIAARVIDLYSVKPVDEETLRQAAADTGAIVTVEDHWPEGGLGDAVLAALAEVEGVRVRKLAVTEHAGLRQAGRAAARVRHRRRRDRRRRPGARARTRRAPST